MIPTHDTFQHSDLFRIANVDQQFAALGVHFTNQDVIALFRRPHHMYRQSTDRMTS